MRAMICLSISGAVALSALISNTPVTFAATPDDFPAVPGAPSWYSSAPSAAYSQETSTSILQSAESNAWGQKAFWYEPSGAAPSNRDGSMVPDIIIDTGASSRSPDSELLIVATSDAFPTLGSGLGTTLTEGVALPSIDNTLDIRFPGHGLVVAKRPAIDCTQAEDPTEHTQRVALLGDNGRKYLAELHLTFGDRSEQKRLQCVSPEPVSTEAATSPTPEATVTASPDTEEPTPVDGDHVGEVLLVAGIAFVGIAALAGFLMFRKGHEHAPHRADGTPVRSAHLEEEEQ